jgi:hypothetical protein
LRSFRDYGKRHHGGNPAQTNKRRPLTSRNTLGAFISYRITSNFHHKHIHLALCGITKISIASFIASYVLAVAHYP